MPDPAAPTPPPGPRREPPPGPGPGGMLAGHVPDPDGHDRREHRRPDDPRRPRRERVDLQWVINAYTLMFAALLLSMGALSDRLGARRVFLAGLVTFAAGSAAAGAVPPRLR